MKRGLVGREEAARLAAEAGGGVEPDTDDLPEEEEVLTDDRMGEVLETVTGSLELSKTEEPSKTAEPFSPTPEPFA